MPSCSLPNLWESCWDSKAVFPNWGTQRTLWRDVSRYVIQRLLQAVAICFGAATLTFLLLRLSSDPAAQLLPLVTVMTWLDSTPGKKEEKGTEHSANAGLAMADDTTTPAPSNSRMIVSPSTLQFLVASSAIFVNQDGYPLTPR